MRQINQSLADRPAVDKILAIAGDEGDVNRGRLFVNLKPKNERELGQKEFQQQMRQTFDKIPGTRISFQNQGPGGGDKDVSLILRSDNPEILADTANQLEQQVRQIPGLVEVSSSVSIVKPEIIIQPDPQRAGDLGVSIEAIARTASLALIGDNEFDLAKFNLPDRQIPIRVQIDQTTPEYQHAKKSEYTRS